MACSPLGLGQKTFESWPWSYKQREARKRSVTFLSLGCLFYKIERALSPAEPYHRFNEVMHFTTSSEKGGILPRATQPGRVGVSLPQSQGWHLSPSCLFPPSVAVRFSAGSQSMAPTPWSSMAPAFCTEPGSRHTLQVEVEVIGHPYMDCICPYSGTQGHWVSDAE